MSRWFRHYAGMVRDDKLVRASIKSKQSIERVVWIWGAVLESASELDDDGRFEVDTDEIARFLRCKPAAIQVVLNALSDLGRIDRDSVSAWGKRQFKSDRSNDRVAAHRANKKQPGNVTRNVTSPIPKRDGNSPETETETETEVDDVEARAGERDPPAPIDHIGLTDEICRTAGIRHVDPGRILEAQGIVRQWLDDGFDPQTEIMPTVRQAITDATERISSLRYFNPALRQNRARQEAKNHGHTPNRSDRRTSANPPSGHGRTVDAALEWVREEQAGHDA